MKVITISFDNGEVKLEAKGFAGPGCAKFTAELEKQLGAATKRVKKPEFYQTNLQQQKAGQG